MSLLKPHEINKLKSKLGGRGIYPAGMGIWKISKADGIVKIRKLRMGDRLFLFEPDDSRNTPEGFPMNSWNI